MAEHWNGGTGGKGSRPRPYSVDQKTFDNNWENIFRKNKDEQKELKTPKDEKGNQDDTVSK
jgi:hypothetical protein